MAPQEKSQNSCIPKKLWKAIDAVKCGESASEVSRRFDVPRSTLIYKATGKSPAERRMGPSPALAHQQKKCW